MLVRIKANQVFYIQMTNSEEPHFIGKDNRVYNLWDEALTSLVRKDIEEHSTNVKGQLVFTNRFLTTVEARNVILRVKEKLAGCAFRRDYEAYLKEVTPL